MVFAELRLAAKHDHALRFVVRNAGPSVARNVTVTFHSPLDAIPDRIVVEAITTQFAKPVAALNPGQQVSNLWWRVPFPSQNLPERSNGEDTPDEVVVQLAYEDDHGRAFTDRVPISVLPFQTEINVSKNPGNRDQDMWHIAQALVMIADRKS